MITVFPSYTIAGFIAAVLVLIPLPRQIRAGNIATMAMTFWFFQHCLATSVNTVVWRGNVIDVAPAWCDISEYCTCTIYLCSFRAASTLRNGVVIALPACTLCVCKHLEFISSRRPITTLNLQLRRTIFELVMCVGLPALWIFIGMSNFITDYNQGT
jgi:pheromone a factor receptor